MQKMLVDISGFTSQDGLKDRDNKIAFSSWVAGVQEMREKGGVDGE